MYYYERFKEKDGNRHRCGRASRSPVSATSSSSRLAVVSRAVSTRGAVQVLAGVRLRASDGRSSSRRPTWRCRCAPRCPPRWRATAPWSFRGSSSADVSACCRLGGGHDRAARGRGCRAHRVGRATRRRLNIFSAEDFPRLPSVDVPLHEIERASLLDTVQRVARASSRDESRPVLTGILVRFEGTTLTMAATDSYRLSVKETQLDSAGPELEAIIPARALAELARIGAEQRDDSARRPRELRHLRLRRHVADVAAHRRAVPEHRAAPARDVRGGGRTAAAPSSSTSFAAPR